MDKYYTIILILTIVHNIQLNPALKWKNTYSYNILAKYKPMVITSFNKTHHEFEYLVTFKVTK